MLKIRNMSSNCNQSNATFQYKSDKPSAYILELSGTLFSYLGHSLLIIVLVRLKVH